MFRIISDFFVYDCTNGRSSLRRKSNHVLKIEEKLLIQQTTGRRLTVRGVFVYVPGRTDLRGHYSNTKIKYLNSQVWKAFRF